MLTTGVSLVSIASVIFCKHSAAVGRFAGSFSRSYITIWLTFSEYLRANGPNYFVLICLSSGALPNGIFFSKALYRSTPSCHISVFLEVSDPSLFSGARKQLLLSVNYKVRSAKIHQLSSSMRKTFLVFILLRIIWAACAVTNYLQMHWAKLIISLSCTFSFPEKWWWKLSCSSWSRVVGSVGT